MAILKTIVKIIAGLLVLMLIYMVYSDWLAKRKDMAFASCNLEYIHLHPNYNSDQSADEKYRQSEYLVACMVARGYEASAPNCPGLDMRTSPSFLFHNRLSSVAVQSGYTRT